MSNPLASQIFNSMFAELYDVPLIDNVYRGDFVERLIMTALGDGFALKSGWNEYDIQHVSGVGIEVKQSAARQQWTETIGRGICNAGQFDIRPRTGYYDGPKWNKLSRPRRFAHLYIFAWHPITDKAEVDHRQADQWRFFVVPESELPAQKTIARRKIESRFPSVGFGELREATLAAIGKLEIEAKAD